uniref:Pentraxin family member n=1 Tax=Laticauda laticaudata TaxID=8630 RepID=A0A8C5S6P7_LATLA
SIKLAFCVMLGWCPADWNKVFVFPASSAMAAVDLHVLNQQPLTDLFSYATQSRSNNFLIIRFSDNDYSIYVGGAGLIFKVPLKEKPSWDHICVLWDSSIGLVQLWLNGEALPRLGLKKGYSISPQASIMLGQDQDSFGGGFDFNQSSVGEIFDVNMWARVLKPVGVRMIWNSITPVDPLIYWRSLSYSIKDEVYVEDLLALQRV